MIAGIPYFGEQTQEITERILIKISSNTTEKKYSSLYELIQSNIDKRIIVVIDNKWFSWLNDIMFNYRDRECYIPYYTFKTYQIPNRTFKTNGKGHLILNGDTLTIRHEYNYKKLNIQPEDIKLQCINIDTQESFTATTDKWITDTSIDLEKLYKLYIENSYKDDDFLSNKHAGGYHYIDRQPRGFRNREKKLREQYDLYEYSSDFCYNSDYRDVRQYKYEEVISKYGLLDNIDLYRERRLRFESYLYCCLRQGLLNELQFRNHIYKVGKEIKLIIKDYWLDNIDKPNKTYIK